MIGVPHTISKQGSTQAEGATTTSTPTRLRIPVRAAHISMPKVSGHTAQTTTAGGRAEPICVAHTDCLLRVRRRLSRARGNGQATCMQYLRRGSIHFTPRRLEVHCFSSLYMTTLSTQVHTAFSALSLLGFLVLGSFFRLSTHELRLSAVNFNALDYARSATSISPR